MNLPNHRMLRKGVIAFIAAGLFWGVDGINAQAETGYITVTDRNEKITKNIHYEGETGEDHPVSVVFLPENVSNGTITVAPENRKIEGIFITGDDDKNMMTINASGIHLEQGTVYGSGSDEGYEMIPGYEGKLEIADGTDISMIGKGERIYGGAIYSSLTPAKEKPYTAISLGEGNTLSYQLEGEETKKGELFGVYNEHTKLTAKDNITVKMQGNMAETENGVSSLKTSGLLNYQGSDVTIGNHYRITSDFTSHGELRGFISGIDSGKETVAEPLGNQMALGEDGEISLSFTGKGRETGTSLPLNDRDELDIRDFYSTHSTYSIGNRSTFTVTLGENSSAFYVDGIRMWPESHGTIGEDFKQNVIIGKGSHVNESHGIYTYKSDLEAYDHFQVHLESDGLVNSSYGVDVNHGTLSLGKEAVITNRESFTGEGISYMDTALYAYQSNVHTGENTKLTMDGGKGHFEKVYGILSISSDTKLGSQGSVTANLLNDTYDGKAKLYGVYTWGDSTLGTLSMGEGGKISVNGRESGSVFGVAAGTNGKAILENGNTIDVTGGTEDEGNTVSLYGMNSTYGIIEAKNNVSLHVYGQGASVYSIYNAGYGDSNYKGKVAVGDNLDLRAEGDQLTIGVENFSYGKGNETAAETEIGKDAVLSVKGADAYGLFGKGKKGRLTLDDGAILHVEGKDYALAVYSSDGAHIQFKGAAVIDSNVNKELGDAIFSEGEDSFTDLTGQGQKVIFGNLITQDEGKLSLAMNTGDSLLTGASYVDGGSTNISMENGALWHMTDDSHLTSLSLKSGATIDMAYNKDYQKLTVDHFDGNGGFFYMKSDLASQTDGDKVHIKDAADGAKGFISVYDKSLVTGKEVTGARHLLMVTDGSGKASFYGKSLSTGGLWDIVPTIRRGGTFTDDKGKTIGNGNEWYLVKLEKQNSEYANALSQSMNDTYGLYREALDTFRQRLGDLRYTADREDRNDFWVRNIHGRYAGSGYDSKYHFLQLGMDTKANDKSYYGFFIERGIASSDFYQGSGKDHTLAGALYATWLGNDGSYTDIVAKAGRNDGTVRTYENNDSVSYREQERSLSVEYGRTIPFGNKGYFAEPEIQLILGHLGSSAFTTEGGTRIHQDAYDSAIGRVGAIIGRKESAGTHPYDFYLKVSLLHEFGGDRAFTLSRTNNYGDEENVAGRDSYKDTWAEAGFGGNLQINSSTYLYADAERSFGADFTKKWQFNVGIHWAF